MKPYVKIATELLLIVSLLFGIYSCAVNPVTGRQELMLLSESDEIKLGRQTDTQVVQEYGIYEDAKLTAYLNDICQRLAISQLVILRINIAGPSSPRWDCSV